MTDPELARRAEAAGVAPRYLNWRDEPVDVPDATLAAILAALEAAPPPASLAGAAVPPGPPAARPRARGPATGRPGPGRGRPGADA